MMTSESADRGLRPGFVEALADMTPREMAAIEAALELGIIISSHAERRGLECEIGIGIDREAQGPLVDLITTVRPASA